MILFFVMYWSDENTSGLCLAAAVCFTWGNCLSTDNDPDNITLINMLMNRWLKRTVVPLKHKKFKIVSTTDLTLLF